MRDELLLLYYVRTEYVPYLFLVNADRPRICLRDGFENKKRSRSNETTASNGTVVVEIL